MEGSGGAKRNTIQKTLVFNAVKELGGHCAADAVFARLSAQVPGISRSTVYRNLGRLAEEDKLQIVAVNDQIDRYDLGVAAGGFNHYHFKCGVCSRVFDVEMDYLGDIYDKIRDKKGFAFNAHNIMFGGVCASCQTKNYHKKFYKEDFIMKKYVCSICGYVYDEEAEGVTFAELDAGWVCPTCGVGKDSFEEE